MTDEDNVSVATTGAVEIEESMTGSEADRRGGEGSDGKGDGIIVVGIIVVAAVVIVVVFVTSSWFFFEDKRN